MVDVLLARGADVNAPSRNGHANAPLHAAAAGRAGAALMRRLLDAGARVNARQSGGHTPLHEAALGGDRKSTRLNSSHGYISYAVFCLKKKKQTAEYSLSRVQ